MSFETDVADLVTEMTETRQHIERGMAFRSRVDELERSINEVLVGIRRPGGEERPFVPQTGRLFR